MNDQLVDQLRRLNIEALIDIPAGTVWTEYHWRAALDLLGEIERLMTQVGEMEEVNNRLRHHEKENERLLGVIQEKDRSIAVIEEYRLKGLDAIAKLRKALEASCVCGAIDAKEINLIPTGTWEYCITCKALAATEESNAKN